MDEKSVLLIIGGGVAAYKSLELIRELGRQGVATRCVLTKAVCAIRYAALCIRSLRRESLPGHVRPDG